MVFWKLGRRKAAEPTPWAPEASAVKTFAVVELWTVTERAVVAMDLGSPDEGTVRLTDALNGNSLVPMVQLGSPPEDGASAIELPPGHAWHNVDVESVLLAFPPSQATDPRRRLHRPRQLIDLTIGPFEVSGSVAIPPGAQAAGYLFRVNARFSPVTRATVRDSRSEVFEQRAEVVLVNLHRVESMRDVGLGAVGDDEDDADVDVEAADAAGTEAKPQ